MVVVVVQHPLDAKLSTALGGRTAAAIERAWGYTTVGEFLEHYPRRYVQRGELSSLDDLPIGEDVTVVADVRAINVRPMRNRPGKMAEVVISDGSGTLSLTFFNPKAAFALRVGARAMFSGRVGVYRDSRQLTHPDFELFDDETDAGVVHDWAERPVPIYPATSALDSKKLRAAIGQLLVGLPSGLDDPVPADVRAERKLLGYREALELIHQPRAEADWRDARATLRFHEAFVLQSALLRERATRRLVAAPPRTPGRLSAEFEAGLPFELTDDQRTVGAAIEADLAAGVPMNRLVQGEVGSGKTLVALRAMLAVADSGGQSAFLAPTEVLAGQHLRSLVSALGPDLSARLRPTLLTGGMPVADRRRALLAAASGGASIVVGTHALLGDTVQFADLSLVVVDEQHRFGVDQREALRLKGTAPHVLVLTATPIPRTVAMTVFGDLDVSTIAQLPAGRSPIQSHTVGLAEHPGWEARVWERLSEELGKGHQGFVVCPAIDAKHAEEADPDEPPLEEGAEGQAARPPVSVAETLELLGRHPLLRERRIQPLHGRMSTDEKDATMRAFAAGDIDVLVATTVIEVGVDVPNASTMIVRDADRFGVAQLHQLRGRVGRGGVPGLCLFVTEAEPGTLARERVDAVAATLDGFELAQVDLELRREGDVLGSTQSGGRSSLKLLRVARDGDLIEAARAAAERILDADPDLADHPTLRSALDRRLDAAERAFMAKA